MKEPLLVISTRPRDTLYGELWDWVGQHGGRRLLVDDDTDAVAAALDARDPAVVVLDANLRRTHRHALRLRSVGKLVVFDHDMCQQFVRDSDWYKLYIPVLKHIAPRLVITSNSRLARELEHGGVAVRYLPKAFSERQVTRRDANRDIPLGFVGRVSNKAYRQRKRFLDAVGASFDLTIARAEPGEEYDRLLHRIGIFISADIGFHEHMIKNFEALAAGCLLVAAKQGDEELLGFENGVNVLLYRTVAEAVELVEWATRHPAEAEAVRRNGLALAWSRHTWSTRAATLRSMLVDMDLPDYNAPRLSFSERLGFAVRKM